MSSARVTASYQVDDLFSSVLMVAVTSMEKEIGRLTADELYADRVGVGDRLQAMLNEAYRPSVLRCTRFDLKDLDIPNKMRESIG